MKKIIGGTTFLDIDDAAPLIGIKKPTLSEWCRTGRITARKVGKKWWLTEADIEEFFLKGSADQGEQDER